MRYCVVCHTEQQKYGQANATLNSAGTGYTGSTVRINDFAVGWLPTHIHKIHMGSNLTMTGYNFGGVLYNNIMYPQQIENCTTCHDGTAGAPNATPNGDNWKNVPSREACGACHDGINFATGAGLTLSDYANGLTSSPSGHIGGAQADDSKCGLCHNSGDIPVYHATVTPNIATVRGSTTLYPVATPQNLPAGAYNLSYQISSVTVNSAGNPVVVFQIQNNGKPVAFNTYSATATEMLPNFKLTGPTFEIAFSVPQEGISLPADWNATASATLVNLWNGTAGTLTGPDSSGNYTATITGTTASPIKIPSGDHHATVLMGYSGFTQTAGTNGLSTTLYPNGLALAVQAVQMTATGQTARRQVVSNDKCNACHMQLGLFTGLTTQNSSFTSSFHSGFNNDANGCSICHMANSADHGAQGYPINVDYWVHSIHAAAKRTVPFPVVASSSAAGFFNIAYPGVLKNCEACHLPGTYSFDPSTAPASAAAVHNRLFSTAASGAVGAAGSFGLSPNVTPGTTYGSGFSYSVAKGTTTPAANNTMVISPIMTACVACHDGPDASGFNPVQHMIQNGGVYYALRSAANPSNETPYDATTNPNAG